MSKELKKKGHKTTIIVPENVPLNLIFDTFLIKIWPNIKEKDFRKKVLGLVKRIILLSRILFQADVIVFYGKLPELLPIKKSYVFFRNWSEKTSFDLFLELSKIRKIGIVYLPSGCLDEFLQVDFMKIETGNICGNCGFWDRCNDKQNYHNFERVRRYSNLNIGNGAYFSNQFVQKSMPYRSLDLDMWNPSLYIPTQLRILKTKDILIVHSFYNSGRNFMNRNIKGTPHIISAVEKLNSEGYSIQLELIHNIPITDMRFIQVQADIVVDELIYGWHGSTTIESLALGKPTICYLRHEWLRNFQESFPDLPEIPVVNATTSTVYDEIKNLCDDVVLRKMIGQKSRDFAEKFFDVKVNAKKFQNEMECLKKTISGKIIPDTMYECS